MAFEWTDELLDQPSSVDVWLPNSDVIEGASQTLPAPPPRRYAAEPHPPQAEPIPQPARQPLQARPQPSTPAPQPQAEGGFDWSRALTALSGGNVGALDSMRASKAQQALAQKQDARRAESDAYALDEQKRRAEILRSASDPQSDASRKMREEVLTGFEVIGESMPGMKPMLQKFAASMQNMSATDMLAMQERMGGVLNIARQAGHDRANEAKSALDRDLRERQIDATISDRAEDNKRANSEMGFKYASLAEQREQRKAAEAAKREEREQARDEKDVAAYQKVAAPIDSNLKTLGDVVSSDVKTGWLPDKWAKARQFIGMKDEAWDTEEAALADVENEIRHGLFGGSLTPGEKAEFLKAMPDMSMPRAARDAKLTAVMKRMAERKQQAGAAHPRAVRAIGGAPKGGTKAPPGAPPGKTIKSPDGKRYRVSDDGATMTEVQ